MELFIFCYKVLFWCTNFKEETDYKLYKNNQPQKFGLVNFNICESSKYEND